jgi:hypothetical protein
MALLVRNVTKLFLAPTTKSATIETTAAVAIAATPVRKKKGRTGMIAPAAVDAAPVMADFFGFPAATLLSSISSRGIV